MMLTVLTRKALLLYLLMDVIMSEILISDVTVWIDGLTLKDGQTIEDIANVLHSHFDIAYPVKYEVTYEECFTD